MLCVCPYIGAGTVRRWRPPPDAITFTLPSSPPGALCEPFIRVDSGVREGDTVRVCRGPTRTHTRVRRHTHTHTHTDTHTHTYRALLCAFALCSLSCTLTESEIDMVLCHGRAPVCGRVCVCVYTQVGTFYDPMIAKVITWAPDRESALALLRKALAETQVCVCVCTCVCVHACFACAALLS